MALLAVYRFSKIVRKQLCETCAVRNAIGCICKGKEDAGASVVGRRVQRSIFAIMTLLVSRASIWKGLIGSQGGRQSFSTHRELFRGGYSVRNLLENGIQSHL